MPSHIFLQLGMWSEAAASNEASWTAADIQEKPKDRSVNPSDLEGYHSLHWLNYIYLQQGRYRDARDLLLLMRQEPALAQALKRLEIQRLEIAAASSAAKGDFNKAIEAMEAATALEESLSPPLGPPELIKPSHELFGEILLRAKRPEVAKEQFATSLRRQENRAQSLLGAARAAAGSGDKQDAANAYAQLVRQWQSSDAQLPALREARDYLKRADARLLGD